MNMNMRRTSADPEDAVMMAKRAAYEARNGLRSCPSCQRNVVAECDECDWLLLGADHAFWYGENWSRWSGAKFSDGDAGFIPSYTTYGDYVGSLYERANQEALVEMLDAAEERVDENLYALRHEGYGASVLLFNPDQRWWPRDVVNAVVGLSEYPLIDEDRHSELEFELIHSEWENFGLGELRQQLEIDEDDVSNAELTERYFQWLSDGGHWPHAESAISVVFPYPDSRDELNAAAERQAQRVR